jgi:3'-phosphoadenosine 5'-phosphosulfate sulfotransferase (PAPS reductase)/FAD synthetase
MLVKNVVSFSGGRTSAYLCYLMIEKFGRENVDFIFMDTGAEHPKTYEFIRKVNDWLDLNLVCLRLKINPTLGEGNSYEQITINQIGQDLEPFKAMMSKYGTPYIHGAFCTQVMKGKPYLAYCKDRYDNDFISWYGIRIDEPTRLNQENPQIELFETKKKTKKQKNVIKYLAEISDFEKQDILDWWKIQPFDLELPEVLGNCVFCIKKGINKIALAAKLEPKMANTFNDAITSDSVRITDREQESEIMYRGDHSLVSIIKMYEDVSADDLAQTIRSMKREDSGSCSESCEATFSSDDFELEIQE